MSELALFGGGGFIGSHLTRRLLNRGHDLHVVDVSGTKIADLRSNDRLHFYELDITKEENDEQCLELIERSDIVFDLVAYANPQQYVDMPLDVVELNYHENLKIVEQCVETDTRIVQFSTCEVYGKLGNRTGDDIEFDEDTSDLITGPVEQHRWIYACAKELLERVVHAHGLENGLKWTIVRPFNFIGPEMDYIIESPDEGTPRVFAAFMSSLLYDHPMYLVDGGTNKRVFTYIDDAIDAIELILKNEGGHFTNEIVNVGVRENETTIRDFASLMRDIYQELDSDGTPLEMREISGKEFYGEGYEDSERRVPSTTKLREAGWEPEYDLREGLEECIQYYIDNYEPQTVTE
jgi:nucleoside-diphosphate-sugar epimerase